MRKEGGGGMTQFPNRSAIYLRIDLALSVPHFFLHFQIPVYTSIYEYIRIPILFPNEMLSYLSFVSKYFNFLLWKGRREGKLKDCLTQFLTSVQFSLKGWSEIFTSLFILQF